MMKAVIDADFFIKLTTNEASGALFMDIMHGLRVTPIMHRYVYMQELKNHAYVRDMVRKNQIEIYDYKDYLITEQDKKEYEKYFLDSYEHLIGDEFPDEDIYTYHMEKEHLGEIRSVYLAIKMGIPYFASDDGGARNFVKNYISNITHELTAISVIDAIRMCKEKGADLNWKKLRGCIPNVYRDDPAKIEVIKEIVTGIS